eukprot:PITA_04708
MDVKLAFLHGFLKEEVYVEQPQGFEEHDRETHVCRVKTSLYGLKKAPRAWYVRIDSYLIKFCFTRSNADPNLYFKTIQGNSADRKNTYECCFSSRSSMISWMSRKWKFVALSKVEAEYIVAGMASCGSVWLRKIFGELFEQVPNTTIIYCDNESEIRIAENLVFQDKSKHIMIKYHYIQDIVYRRVVRLYHISTDDQIADILTKSLPEGKFLVFRE